MKTVPKWQRCFCAFLALGILAGLFAQLHNGLIFSLENSYLLFKLFFAMIGGFLFSYIAVCGYLPFRDKRDAHVKEM